MMASHESDDFDLPAHRQTYEFVVKLFQYGTIFCVIVLVGMAFFLT